MGVISSKSTVKQVKEKHPSESSSDSSEALELETVHLLKETKNTRPAEISSDSSEGLELETVQLPKETKNTGLEKQDVKHVEDNRHDDGVASDMPITEAEKLRHLYRKEQALGLSGGNIVVKKDVAKNTGRQSYRTSGYHDTGRHLDPPETEDKETSKLDANETGGNEENKDREAIELENNKNAALQSTMKNTGNPVRALPMSPRSTSMVREIDGSLVSNTFSQHCPGLLEQTRNTDGSLRPLAMGKLRVERNQIRTELEKQGILTTDARSSVDQVDPKQEGIIGELRQMGIIQRVKTDDPYTMSSGMPKRRPPPRLSQLPLTDKEQITPTDTLVRKHSLIDKVLLPKETEKTPEVASDGADESNSEYFRTLGTENVGDAEKLKLKLFDMDML